MTIREPSSLLDAEDESNLASLLQALYSLERQSDKVGNRLAQMEQEISDLCDEVSHAKEVLGRLVGKLLAKHPNLEEAREVLLSTLSNNTRPERGKKKAQEKKEAARHGIDTLVIVRQHDGSSWGPTGLSCARALTARQTWRIIAGQA